MKNLKRVVLIGCILIIVVIVLFFLSQYITRNKSPLPKEMRDKKEYSIVICTYNNTFNGLGYELYFILDKEKKVIDTRKSVSGYTTEELNNMYNVLCKMNDVHSNVEIQGESLIYNEVWKNGKSIDKVIEELKNETYFSNLTIKEI